MTHPIRARSHRLESESRQAFRALCPSTWVIRDITEEYGVDLEVEIFRDDGSPTGLLFHVQLKGTDESDLDRALRVRFKATSLRYLKGHALPALLARFVRPSNQIFTKWVNEWDPYPAGSDQKTYTVSFERDSEWSPQTPSRLQQQLELLRDADRGRMEIPVEVTLSVSLPERFSRKIPVIQQRIRATASKSRSLRWTTENAESAAPARIEIRSDRLTVSFVGRSSFSVHYRVEHVDDELLSSLPADSLVILGEVLSREGLGRVGLPLILRHLQDCSVITNPEIAIQLARTVARNGRLSDALIVADRLFQLGEENRLTALMIAVPFEMNARHVSDPELELLRSMIERWATRCEEEGHKAAAGSYHYSLANHLRCHGEHRRSFKHYRMAAQLDPEYLVRGYWWAEFAGSLYHLGRYSLSARFYREAQGKGFDRDVTLQLADALLHSREYSKAASVLQEKVGNRDGEPESSLVAMALGTSAIDRLTQYETSRSPNEQQSKRPGNPEIDSSLFDALQANPLDAAKWFELGAQHARNGSRSSARDAFLASAAIEPHSLDAWVNAFFQAAFEYDETAIHIARAAYFCCQEALLGAIVEALHESVPPEVVQQFLELLEQAVIDLRNPSQEMTLRMLGSEGFIAEHVVSSDSRSTALASRNETPRAIAPQGGTGTDSSDRD